MMASTSQAASALRHPFFDFNDAADVILPRHDKDEIRTRLLHQLESVLLYLFPRGKRRGSQFYIGNLQGEPGDSLVVELEGSKRGVWIDFATGESGDVLALWASIRGYHLPADFSDLLEDAGDWLMVPRMTSVPVIRATSTYDDLGPHTGKWDYLAADGSLLACVYRHDTPTGKQYRPWDVRARAMRMPEPRPLYNLPAIATADAVVLVEGEKCADALMQRGIVATTAMGGAATALDKTDWTPLAGKMVAVWPDHDEAGARYADAVIQKLIRTGATVRRVSVPQDKPAKWDAADAVEEGFDVEGLLRSSQLVSDTTIAATPALDITRWRAADRFTGQPQPRRWLVEGVFPQAQAALIAAAGGVGKSFLLLALTREVATFDSVWANAPTLFGGALTGQGVAIYITAEDDAIEVHNRLNALGPIPDRLYVLPLPDAGGAVPLFAPDPATRGPAITAAWMDLERQLKAVPSLCLVVLDPLQPLCALDLNVPENAQFVCSRLAALAASTGASVIVSHHFAKREASTPEQAREAIRGTGGLVDGVRAVYALWHPKEDQAKKLCEALGEPFERGRVVMGGVVKANGRANLRVATFLRSTSGLLVDCTDRLRQTRPEPDDLLPALKSAIARAARDGKPYTKTGGNGLYERRHELPEPFHAIGKHRLTGWVDALLAQGELVTAMAEGSRLVKWLDVPDGPVAQGQAVFVTGHLTRSSAGRPVVE
ncbi:AAA family ATPase [Extensimonas vulgaris]|uniref:Plasmid and phage replicative helicase /plasmid and phage DNA primase n=1 Tax=Extensimonas vulgaris TaxID=1031594 RepID=A0A369AGQ8_9BURK|nr:AAA family ATPase [Extensimonas vulgaris]RCX08285.1 plasmid and phage replicative helicase /plasmid and phage DNA primase [Extensimonas vulgaris]TWI37443.1 plasmid and phage replicative helicase/plasmid and phage DNA primase [Extensimonas vulgaris]TXD13875.1 AAA family ATPase [Extensimonas vulgaris]